MAKGASKTLVIEWNFEGRHHPELEVPIATLEAWWAHWSALDSEHQALTARAWTRAIGDISTAHRNGPTSVYDEISSAMSATIVTLREAGWAPSFPT